MIRGAFAFAALAFAAVAVAPRAAPAAECGFSGRDAVYADDHAPDRKLLASLAEAVRSAGHACPRARAAARCRHQDRIFYDVFCDGADYVLKLAKGARDLGGAEVAPVAKRP